MEDKRLKTENPQWLPTPAMFGQAYFLGVVVG